MALVLMLVRTLVVSPNGSPVFVVSADLRRDVGIREDRELAVRLRHDSGALNILVVTKTNVDWMVANCFEQTSTGVLVEHALAECSELLPLIATVLYCRVNERLMYDAKR